MQQDIIVKQVNYCDRNVDTYHSVRAYSLTILVVFYCWYRSEAALNGVIVLLFVCSFTHQQYHPTNQQTGLFH